MLWLSSLAMSLPPLAAWGQAEERSSDQFGAHVVVDDRTDGCVSEDILRGEVAALLPADKDFRLVWIRVFAGNRPGESRLHVAMVVKDTAKTVERRELDIDPADCPTINRVLARIAAVAAEPLGRAVVPEPAPGVHRDGASVEHRTMRPPRGPLQASCGADLGDHPNALEVYRRCFVWLRDETKTTVVGVPGTAPVYGGTGGFVTTTNYMPITTQKNHAYQGVDGRPLEQMDFYRAVGREDLHRAQVELQRKADDDAEKSVAWALVASGGSAATFAGVSALGLATCVTLVIVNAVVAVTFFEKPGEPKLPGTMLPISVAAGLVGFLAFMPIGFFLGGLLASPMVAALVLLPFTLWHLGDVVPDALPPHEKRLVAREFNHALMEELGLEEKDVEGVVGNATPR